MQAAAAEELGIEPEQVGVASTGVIGVELPRDKVVDRRARRRAPRSGRGRATSFSQAILTSDAGPKRACLEVDAARPGRCGSRPRPRAPG